jgi:plastocyanin
MRRAWTAALVLLTTATGVGAIESGTVKGTVSAASGPVVDAVVLIDTPAEGLAPGAPHAVIRQRDGKFSPHVLAVPAGTTVDFPNDDPVLHNVGSSSPAKRFDLGMYPQGETKSVTFDAPGVVEIRCNVHPDMSAFVVVHASPHAAVTDARGAYTIAGIPAGRYPVRVWHGALAERPTTVTVTAGGVQALDLRLEPRR